MNYIRESIKYKLSLLKAGAVEYEPNIYGIFSFENHSAGIVY